MKTVKKDFIFFPNLDALRFFCFLSVFFYHSFSSRFENVSSNPAYKFIKHGVFGNGYLGVNFFFVLSGFLITYLLLKEKQKFGKVHIGNFYLRRVLRIWPLFFFCVFFGFIIFPNLKAALGEVPSESANWVAYVFFVNNLDYITNGADSSTLSILWSVAIEEQFYLVWPLIIGFCNRRLLPYLLAAILIGSLVFRMQYAHDDLVIKFHTFSCISDMTVGGIGAFLAINSTQFMNRLRSLGKVGVLFCYGGALLFFFFHQYIFYHSPLLIAVDRLVGSIFFLSVILVQNFSVQPLFQFRHLSRISKLGQYTYGLYCLHMIGLLAATIIIAKFKLDQSVSAVLIIGGSISLGLTLVMAYTSYQYFELPFLKLKDRLAFIKTEPLAGQKAKERKDTEVPSLANQNTSVPN
jgi:peptidoglycan/LPS O-acetylase OafA/YrhL